MQEQHVLQTQHGTFMPIVARCTVKSLGKSKRHAFFSQIYRVASVSQGLQPQRWLGCVIGTTPSTLVPWAS